MTFDGHPLKESGSAFRLPSTRAAPTAATLVGHVVVPASAGSHVVQLEWRAFGHDVALWWSQPDFLDGYAAGRSLVVTAEVLPVPVSTQPYEKDGNNLLGGMVNATSSELDSWRPVQGATVSFDLATEAAIKLSYSMTLGVADA